MQFSAIKFCSGHKQTRMSYKECTSNELIVITILTIFAFETCIFVHIRNGIQFIKIKESQTKNANHLKNLKLKVENSNSNSILIHENSNYILVLLL